MTTEWTDLPTLPDVAAAVARGDYIECFSPHGIELSRWYGTSWDAISEYRSRPKQKTPEDRIAELEQKIEVTRGVLQTAKIGLRDWDIPDNRYVALISIDATLAALGDAKPASGEEKP